MGVFDDYRDEVWPFTYDVEIRVKDLHGGRPQDPRVVEGWIKSKIQDNDERLRQLVSEAIQDLGYHWRSCAACPIRPRSRRRLPRPGPRA